MNNELTQPSTAAKSSTVAGNYFISNYPPFSFWSEDQKVEVELALNSEPTPGAKLGVYHHIPFCRKRCHFCYFRVYTDKNAKEIQSYLDATMIELKSLAERPLIRGRKPHVV
jgi:oxygen-independent coproporphyrinogen-3 oxidase